MDFGPISNNGNAALVTSTTASTQAAPDLTSENRELIKAVKALNATDLFGSQSELTFVFDRETRRALVRVVDKQTRKVVMQIPPEYVIRMAEENGPGEAGPDGGQYV
jgi:uncharacterized FlaG/YvyC family protein